MPLFHYRALRPSGGEIAGELTAVDERDAAQRLQAIGNYPIEITLSEAGARLARRFALSGTQEKPIGDAQHVGAMSHRHLTALVLFGSLKNIARRLLESVRYLVWEAAWFDPTAARKLRLGLEDTS